MRQTLSLIAALAGLAACEANVVDAVSDPVPVLVPAPEPQSPLATWLIHRYGFAGEGARVLDEKGAAHGDALGAGLVGDGGLQLGGEHTAEYVDLPNGIISGLSSVTLEAWLTWRGGGSWQRIFDFGSSSAGDGAPGVTGTSYLFLTTESADDAPRLLSGALRAAFSENGVSDEDICHGPAPFPIGVLTHVALVLDPGAEAMLLYQDGKLLTSCFLARPLSAIDDVNNWLGHSNYAADPDLSGRYDEFRIYAAALTAEQLASSFAAGPDAKP